MAAPQDQGRMSEGAPIRYDGVSVVEFRDGKVQRFRAYFDPSALKTQMTRNEP